PIVTPLIVFLLLRETVDVNTTSMFISMAEVVVIPLVLGFVISYMLPEQTSRVSDA
ncbi:MAG: bile acid:sodium symporter, partial [Candidatus Methanomethylophilus sp.]|nr:bile acid:sodium symporter [Methanomethylophilus sp.]